MSYEQVEEQLLVDQLGTEPEIRDKDQYDYQILSILSEKKIGPYMYFGLVNEIIKAKEDQKPISFSEAFYRPALKLPVSVGGRGRRDVLYSEQVRRGVGINITREIPKPSRLDRVLNPEKVKAYEEQEKELEGLEYTNKRTRKRK